MSTDRPTNGILEDFRIEFLDCWQRLPNKGLFFVLLAAWLALFQFLGNSTLGYIHSTSLMNWMWLAYQPSGELAMSDDGHGKFIPFVVLGLFWWKRKELFAQPLRSWPPALGLVALGLLFHLAGYLMQQPRISIVGLFVGIYGLTGLAWGPGWLKASFFPFFLFAFCVPLGSVGQSISFPLQLLVCKLVEFVSHFVLAIDILRDGTLLRDPTGHYQYEVAAACSGMRSLIATVALGFAYAFLGLKTWWKRGLLIASAFPLAVLGNLLRMLTIVISAEIGGQSVGNYVHEGGPLGIISLLPYVPPFAGMMLLGHWLREDRVEPVANLQPEVI